MMGSNTMCRVIGINNVNLKLNNRTIRELKQVRNVPRNLISLGMLDQLFRVKPEFDGLMIFNCLKLVIKGGRKNVMYILDGEVIFVELKVSTRLVTHITKLWHLYLGHMSLKSLKDLEKYDFFFLVIIQ